VSTLGFQWSDVCVTALLTAWSHLSACQYLRNPSLLSCHNQFYRVPWNWFT